MRLDGMNVISSELAVHMSPARILKRKRWMSTAYHRRVQKKWVKRWGHKTTPGAFVMTSPLTGRQELLMHPTLIAEMKAKMLRLDQLTEEQAAQARAKHASGAR